MKKSCYVLFVVALLSTAVTGLCEDNKVAVVDLKKVIKEHPQAISDRKILQKQKDDFIGERTNLEEKKKALMAEIQDISRKADAKALSDTARDKMREEVRGKIDKLQAMALEIKELTKLRQQQLQEQEMRMLGSILDDLKLIIKKQAKKDGYSLVVDASVVLYSDDKIDITKDVIKKVIAEEKK